MMKPIDLDFVPTSETLKQLLDKKIINLTQTLLQFSRSTFIYRLQECFTLTHLEKGLRFLAARCVLQFSNFISRQTTTVYPFLTAKLTRIFYCISSVLRTESNPTFRKKTSTCFVVTLKGRLMHKGSWHHLQRPFEKISCGAHILTQFKSWSLSGGLFRFEVFTKSIKLP